MYPVFSKQTRLIHILPSDHRGQHPVTSTWCLSQVRLPAGFSLPFSFGIILDQQKSCQDSTEFPYTVHSVSLNRNILQNCSTFVKTKKLISVHNEASDFPKFLQVSPAPSSVCSRIPGRHHITGSHPISFVWSVPVSHFSLFLMTLTFGEY